MNNNDVFRRFKKHKWGAFSSLLILLLLLVCLPIPAFFAPYAVNSQHISYMYVPPQKIHFVDVEGHFHFRPFVYGLKHTFDLETAQDIYREDTSELYPVRFFVHGYPYKVLFFEADIHLFGVEKGGHYFALGTDRLGRDLFSRILYGGQISLLIGLLTPLIAMYFGAIVGLLSGYYGGIFDMVVQRIIEIFMSIPSLPLLMVLSAAFPARLPAVYRLMAVIGVLALVGWTGLARQVRGKVLALREEDYIMSAKAIGASSMRIAIKHLLPNTFSHIIIVATLSVPFVILSESGLSFLGLGVKPPLTSWGLLLSDAQNVQAIQSYPWLLFPGVFIFVAIFLLNFCGDALRDAFDPFAERRA
jgi:peptide/nickel transport system permease protein